ncbi:DUF1656 domain-containing protein [Consotaella salsifontis]|uniref:DUF1656 domain-containing protein n=1 Tax=Consotaella salsifontis TaxID=1365950 RepID=A0A1T4T8W7_9HYPH|nr:DUF1656 domain-containing protein [Consotaella salsifontis]SKA36935.1 Protein of unknown function [Consotaella salsifontis]
MTGQVDLYGVFVPAFGLLILSAYGAFRLAGWALHSIGFYRLVWHRPLFNLALFLALLAGLSLTMQWYQR